MELPPHESEELLRHLKRKDPKEMGFKSKAFLSQKQRN